MFVMVGLSAVALSMMQATVAAPTAEFRGCIREAVAKAEKEKVGADGIEDYLRGACTVQMSTLKDALIAFRIKNGMGRSAAASDAQLTIDDYVATPADNYRYMAERDAKAQQRPAPTPASSPQPQRP